MFRAQGLHRVDVCFSVSYRSSFRFYGRVLLRPRNQFRLLPLGCNGVFLGAAMEPNVTANPTPIAGGTWYPKG